MASLPAIAIVPGSFSPSSYYTSVVEKLKAFGFSPVELLSYPSIGRKDDQPAAGMADDAKYIHSELERLADAGIDVFINAHSYAGVPTSEALRGLSKEHRAGEGKRGGVVGIVFTAALTPPPGKSLNDVMGGSADQGAAPHVKINGEYMWLEPTGNAKFNFSDMPYEEAMKWTKDMPEHSTVSFVGELTYPGYKDVPVSYIFTENDKTVPPEMQRAQIDAMEQEIGKKVKVHAIPTGHFPYISYPDIVAEKIRKAASEIGSALKVSDEAVPST